MGILRREDICSVHQVYTNKLGKTLIMHEPCVAEEAMWEGP